MIKNIKININCHYCRCVTDWVEIGFRNTVKIHKITNSNWLFKVILNKHHQLCTFSIRIMALFATAIASDLHRNIKSAANCRTRRNHVIVDFWNKALPSYSLEFLKLLHIPWHINDVDTCNAMSTQGLKTFKQTQIVIIPAVQHIECRCASEIQ